MNPTYNELKSKRMKDSFDFMICKKLLSFLKNLKIRLLVRFFKKSDLPRLNHRDLDPRPGRRIRPGLQPSTSDQVRFESRVRPEKYHRWSWVLICNTSKNVSQKVSGLEGNWTPGLSHAKRAWYHYTTSPTHESTLRANIYMLRPKSTAKFKTGIIFHKFR